MIGYDLDGVLCSDMEFQKPVIEFLAKRHTQKALFVPSGQYVIITGRPKEDRSLTEEWISRELRANLPVKLFHDNELLVEAAEYKARIINAEKIDIFIESNHFQAMRISWLAKRTIVYTLQDLMNYAIPNL